jgi:hypothetical protein
MEPLMELFRSRNAVDDRRLRGRECMRRLIVMQLLPVFA